MAEVNGNNRQRFLDACACRPVDRPPIWMMRQAGRALPEYRELKKKHSFIEMVQTPDLATEVTLQPIRRFGFDAAVMFSDILVIPEAMGQGYTFREEGGIQMDFSISGQQDVDRLCEAGVVERLDYVAQAIGQIKMELDGQTALLGFTGSPWTLANYMMEGGSASEFLQARRLCQTEPKLFEQLMEKLTVGVTDYLKMQAESGVDAVQIFDSLGGLLSSKEYEEISGRWIRRVIESLEGAVPVILFSRGTAGCLQELVQTGAQVLGLDWSISLAEARLHMPATMGVQGNLDPVILTTTPEIAVRETTRILEEMRGQDGFIFNLGHGVTPDAKIENIESVVAAVKGFK
jgi:uroporphyrinogen decarboxylase